MTRVAALSCRPSRPSFHFLTFGVFYRNKADESERRNLLCVSVAVVNTYSSNHAWNGNATYLKIPTPDVMVKLARQHGLQADDCQVAGEECVQPLISRRSTPSTGPCSHQLTG